MRTSIWKKISSLVLAVAVIFTSGVSVFAEEECSVVITSPVSGSIVYEGMSVRVTAAASGAEAVTFAVDGVEKETATEAPYTFVIEEMKAGGCTVTASAQGANGKVASDSVFITDKETYFHAGFETTEGYTLTGAASRIVDASDMSGDIWQGESGKFAELGTDTVGANAMVNVAPKNMTDLSGKIAIESRILFTETVNLTEFYVEGLYSDGNAYANRLDFKETAAIEYAGNRPTGYMYEANQWYKVTYVIDLDAKAYYLYLDDQKIWTWKNGGFYPTEVFENIVNATIKPVFVNVDSRVYIDYLRAYDWTEPDSKIMLDEQFNAVDGARNNTDYLGRFTSAATAGGNFDIVSAPAESGMTGKVLTIPANVAAEFVSRFPADGAKKLKYSFDFYMDEMLTANSISQIYFERCYASDNKWAGYELLFFDPNGTIRYHNGTTYATATVSWSEKTPYHIELELDTVAFTYNIYITGGSMTDRTLLVSNASVAAFATSGYSGLTFGIDTKKTKATNAPVYFDNFKLEKVEYVDLQGPVYLAETGKTKIYGALAPAGQTEIQLAFHNDMSSVTSADTVTLYRGETPVEAVGEYDADANVYVLKPVGGLLPETEYRIALSRIFNTVGFTFMTGGENLFISDVDWSKTEGGLTASISIGCSEYLPAVMPAAVILCTYKDTVMTAIGLETVEVEPGKTKTVKLEVSDTEGDAARVYVWDSLSHMSPLGESASMPQ